MKRLFKVKPRHAENSALFKTMARNKSLKSHYLIDSKNRFLRVRRPAAGRKEVTVADGEFSVSADNVLIYSIREEERWRREFDFPDKLKFKGKWRLDKNHDLELALDDTPSQWGNDVLTLRGEIADTRANELSFLITSRRKAGIEETRLIRLSGLWKTDEFNRLGFSVSKENGKENVLLLDGLWKAGGNNEIVYSYRKTRLIRKVKEERSLIFRGHWQVTARDRLSYLMDTSGRSGFLFKAQLESPRVTGKKGLLQYRIGIGLSSKKRPVERIIKLFGAVKYNLTAKDELVLELAGSRGRKPEAAISLNKKILGGKVFLQFKEAAEDRRIEAGLKIPW